MRTFSDKHTGRTGAARSTGIAPATLPLSRASTPQRALGNRGTQQVGINRDPQLVRSVREEGASGAARGNQIALHPDINPHSPAARRVINHELTHVEQWRRGQTGSEASLEQQAVADETGAHRSPYPNGFFNRRGPALPAANSVRFRTPRITSFKLQTNTGRITVFFDDDTFAVGEVSSHNLKAGAYQVTYDPEDKLLIFDGLDAEQIVVNYAIDDKGDRKKHKKALRKLTEPVPFQVSGPDFSNLTVKEDPFSIDDTGLLGQEDEEEVFDPTKVTILTAGELTLPDWVPAWAQKEVKADTYVKLARYKVRDGNRPERGDGVYIIPADEVGHAPWGDLLIQIDHPGGGYWRVQMFHEYPNDPDFYTDLFAGEEEFKETLFHDVYTGFNRDMRYMVVEKGYSIAEAREELRRINAEVFKLTITAALTLFTSAFGMSAMSAGGGKTGAGGGGSKTSGSTMPNNKRTLPPAKKPPTTRLGKMADKLKKAGEKVKNKLPGNKDWAKINRQLYKEEAESAGAAGMRLYNTRRAREGYTTVRTIVPNDGTTYRHSLTVDHPFILGNQLKSIKEDGLRVSTGVNSARYGEGIYMWEKGYKLDTRYYIDIRLPKEDVAIERLYIHNAKGENVGEWYRALPKEGDHLKVEIIDHNIPEQFLKLLE